MAAPEPKPTLLASIGVTGGEAPPASASPTDLANQAPASETHDSGSRNRRRRPSQSPRTASSPTTQDRRDPAPATLSAALNEIRQRHRERRTSGERTPLAPLNVDVPLDLLEHVRQVSQDIPYPLRRLAEEAIELWLEATGNQRASAAHSPEAPNSPEL
ncbi:MAG: hypothetical protein LC808_15960 [Actinobacteria bacterium]|nr:hypothetical protein [Actinomycetota bacterium]